MSDNEMYTWLAAVENNKEAIQVLGNLALIKKGYNIPRHLLNPMEKDDIVAYLIQYGKAVRVGSAKGYNFDEVTCNNAKMIWVQKGAKHWFLIL